jgi:hypothetical protein
VSNLLGADPVERGRHRHGDPAADVYSALDERGIAWLLLRGGSERGSERDQPGADVDLLLDARELEHASQAIADAGFARLSSPGRGPHRFFVRYLEGEERWIKLDLVDAIAFGRFQELGTNAAAGVLSRRRRQLGLAVPSTDDAFWTVLLHCLLDKGRIAPAHRMALAAHAAGAGTKSELAQLVEAAVRGKAVRLVALARAGDWSRLEAAGAELRRGWRRRHGRGARARALRNRLLRRAGSLRRSARLPTVELRAPEPVAASCVAALRRACPLPVRSARGAVGLRLRELRGQVGVVIVEPASRRRRAEISLTVDASADPATTARELSALIWRAMAARSEVRDV